jgi:hypothetical protein
MADNTQKDPKEWVSGEDPSRVLRRRISKPSRNLQRCHPTAASLRSTIGLKIGIAEYDEGPTGCTVLSFDAPATCVSDICGGAPGFLGGFGVADAICFAGGSLYGLDSSITALD